ncbi:MAG: hypothetical protein KGL35_06435 [Bradyrhizobium sp.]|nr:hypothetical protein [Bradyrhizobium sp.]
MVIITKSPIPSGFGYFGPGVRIRIETDTHVAHTSMPVYTHRQFIEGKARGVEVLGIFVKPHVRVKMRRLDF